jgi:hypothetical protein
MLFDFTMAAPPAVFLTETSTLDHINYIKSVPMALLVPITVAFLAMEPFHGVF